jgi:hypothetical protein
MSEEARQMYRQLTSRYGRLKAVKPSGGNRVELEFENGTVDRPPLLTCGYRGTGVDNLRVFLCEAGLDTNALVGIDESSWGGISVS